VPRTADPSPTPPLARTRTCLAILGLILAAAGPAALAATAKTEPVDVAVASNFLLTLRALERRFETATGSRLLISHGSTGMLYARISNGAPIDVFLAADSDSTERLVDDGLALPDSRITYARGRLVLWSNAPENRDQDCLKLLQAGRFKRLAIANPRLAPYGTAARETLQKLRLWRSLRKSVIRGENINQAFQYVMTQNADLGFVALSQLKAGDIKSAGCRWAVPENFHAPLVQTAVLLKRGDGKPAARALMDFIVAETTRVFIRNMGYLVQ